MNERYGFSTQEMIRASVREWAARAETAPGGVKRIARPKDVRAVNDLSHGRRLRVSPPRLSKVSADENVVQLIAIGYDLARAGVASTAENLPHIGATRVVDMAVLSKARENRRGET